MRVAYGSEDYEYNKDLIREADCCNDTFHEHLKPGRLLVGVLHASLSLPVFGNEAARYIDTVVRKRSSDHFCLHSPNVTPAQLDRVLLYPAQLQSSQTASGEEGHMALKFAFQTAPRYCSRNFGCPFHNRPSRGSGHPHGTSPIASLYAEAQHAYY
jgi:hypothetical protein